MHEEGFWKFVRQQIAADVPMVLMVVVSTEDNTPGKPGFKMAVASDGSRRGTVGGGALEHQLVQQAHQMLDARDVDAQLFRLQLADNEQDEPLDMICGGTQTIALCPLRVSDSAAVERILGCLREGKAVRLRLTPEGLSVREGEPAGDPHHFTRSGDDRWRYEETLGLVDSVYIVGGGHVGMALSRALAPLDLRVVVMDERRELETLRENRWAQQKQVIPFDEVGEHIPEGDGTYVVISTPRHSADECVLRQIIRKPLRYLGMLASTRKVTQIKTHMRADGFSDEVLGRVRSPVGLPINSHTPAEIAISIAAEIIKVKNS